MRLVSPRLLPHPANVGFVRLILSAFHSHRPLDLTRRGDTFRNNLSSSMEPRSLPYSPRASLTLTVTTLSNLIATFLLELSLRNIHFNLEPTSPPFYDEDEYRSAEQGFVLPLPHLLTS